MVKSLCIIFLSVCFNLTVCFAQNESEIKTIQRKMDYANDTTKIKLCRSLYDSFFYTNLEKALDYARKGYDLASSNNLKKETAEFSYKIGNVYLLESKFSSALIYYLKSINIAEEINDNSTLAKCYFKVGSTYFDQENLPKALEYFFKYLKINKETDEKVELSMAYRTIGKVYEKQGIFKKSNRILLSVTSVKQIPRRLESCVSRLKQYREYFCYAKKIP